jgi:MFS family permease
MRDSAARLPVTLRRHQGVGRIGAGRGVKPRPHEGRPLHETSVARRAAGRPVWLIDNADFWRLWFVGLVVFSVRWVETVAVGVFVYQRTGSAFIVAMMTMLRLLPMGLFGAFLGAIAERMERRTTLVLVVAVMLVNALVLATLAHLQMLEVWHLGVTSFVNGVGWATDNPVRRVMIGEAVGSARMGVAMSIDVGANNASRMVGPAVGGLLLAGVGIEGVFALSVVLYAVSVVAALRVRYRNSFPPTSSDSVLARIAEGLSLARRDKRLIGTLTVTVIYNVFGWPFTSMVPVIGQDQLGLGPEGIGVLASMDGIGAFVGAVLMAMFCRPHFFRQAYVGGVTIYLVMLIAFALVPMPLIAGSALVFTGLSGAAFSIMQATLVYLSAPPEMRSRILGVLSVCIGTGPVGFIALGMLADAIGAPWATAASGITGLLALLLTRRLWRVI